MDTATQARTGAASVPTEDSEEVVAAAFGLSAAVTVVFNVVLAFVKDSTPALNSFMAHLTGHHWRTHDLADLIVFFVLGWVFMKNRIPAPGLTQGLAVTVASATVFVPTTLGLWFLVM